MRVLLEIPHHTFKITVFGMNAKYVIKVEWGPLEQTFKIAELDVVGGLDEVKKLLTDDFLRSCMVRFHAMSTDFNTAIQQL
ncbi:MAG: hypothetical protein V4616_11725 [Bacteroidota bacterium]